jgi:hypothetical protein
MPKGAPRWKHGDRPPRTLAQQVERAHQEVDALRKSLGLAPWDWEKHRPKAKGKRRVFRDVLKKLNAGWRRRRASQNNVP